MNGKIIILALSLLSIVGCKNRNGQSSYEKEDKQAKSLLQGLWVDNDADLPVMLVRGDSIFYPDSASMPTKFWVYKDSLYLQGQHLNAYKIRKQAPHYFVFVNANGEDVEIAKSNNKLLQSAFKYHVYAMNLFEAASADTLVRTEDGYFTSRVDIKTLTDRVYKTDYNDYGMEVDNAYLDNVATLNILNHDKLVYSHEFRKGEFASLVPESMLQKCILRSFEFVRVEKRALIYNVTIGVPDADTSSVIELRLVPNGKITKRLL